MWIRKFTKIYTGVSKDQIWRAWTDVNNWPAWDTELEYCTFAGSFNEGEQFILKPKGGPKVNITLSNVQEQTAFSDYCRFPGAIMHDHHELTQEVSGVRITNTITVSGILGFLWAHLVAKHVANAVPTQTDNLVKYVREQHA